MYVPITPLLEMVIGASFEGKKMRIAIWDQSGSRAEEIWQGHLRNAACIDFFRL